MIGTERDQYSVNTFPQYVPSSTITILRQKCVFNKSVASETAHQPFTPQPHLV